VDRVVALRGLPAEGAIQQIDRVSKLISGLLNLGRAQTGSGGRADLKAVCDEAILLLAQKFRENRIEVVTDLQENLAARISHSKLEQVLLNLLVNSIHAIQSKSKTSTNETEQITLRAWERKGMISLMVIDTGCGIAQQNINDIFKPFYTTKPIGEGTGLGLSISSQLIHDAGGSIIVESILGKGSTFTIQIPGYFPAQEHPLQ
jgi:C4-dicarboxylate-specific signal transduction histidine kinase